MPEDVKLEGVTKIYNKSKKALDNVSFEVPAGQFLVLLGPSGSGKTTLLRAIAGIERISGGSIAISGQYVATDFIHIPPNKRNLSMVFQDYALWPHLSVLDNVAFALKRHGLAKQECRNQAREMLDTVGLTPLADNYPSDLSGGEQQRVSLARALVAKSGLLLFDEPLSNLDADLRDRLRIEIATLSRAINATSVYITHDQSEAFALADIIGVLQGGKLVQIDTPENIYGAPATPFVARFTGLAGEIDVIVDQMISGSMALVVPLAGGMRPFYAKTKENINIGPGKVMIRPTALQLCAVSDDSCHTRAIIKDSAFRGHGYEHVVIMEDGTQLTNIFTQEKHHRGEAVGIIFHHHGSILFGNALSVDKEEVTAG